MDTTTAQVTADLQAIFLGQKDIQDDQVIGGQFGEILSLLPIIGGIDAIAFMGQISCQRTTQPMVVFYDKDAHGKASFILCIPDVHMVPGASALSALFSLLCIMAYLDDNLMTKMSRDVHLAVTSKHYTPPIHPLTNVAP